MNILTQTYNLQQEEDNFKLLNEMLYSLIDPLDYNPSHVKYGKMMNDLSSFIYSFARKILVSAIEKADKDFRNQPNRVERYYVKQTRPRTLITPFGFISFMRTEYTCRLTNENYIYIDRKLNLLSHERYDSAVQSMIVQEYANHNSMLKVGRLVGEHMCGAYCLDSNRDMFRISRQTVYNILKRRSIIYPISKAKETPETLYIMADEKYIPLQREEHPKDVPHKPIKKMEKVACIFSGREKEYKNRYKLNDKFYFTAESNFWEELYEVIITRYDYSDIKQIVILGDGASWIKSGTSTLKTDTIKTMFALDKFHLNQAILRMTSDKLYREQMLYYIINDSKKDFEKMTEIVLEGEPSKEKAIQTNKEYIINNWHYIQNAFKKVDIGCAMEQVISHVMASAFTSVPKAYSRSNLPRYVANRIASVNNFDLQKLFLEALDAMKENNSEVDLRKEEYDWSIFDPANDSYKSSQTYFAHHGAK